MLSFMASRTTKLAKKKFKRVTSSSRENWITSYLELIQDKVRLPSPSSTEFRQIHAMKDFIRKEGAFIQKVEA